MVELLFHDFGEIHGRKVDEEPGEPSVAQDLSGDADVLVCFGVGGVAGQARAMEEMHDGVAVRMLSCPCEPTFPDQMHLRVGAAADYRFTVVRRHFFGAVVWRDGCRSSSFA